MLAANSSRGESRLDSVLRSRALGLFRLRLVLGFGLFVGLGTVPLRAMVPSQSHWLVLGTGHSLGSIVGELAFQLRLLRLGAAAADCLFSGWSFHILWTDSKR